MIFERLNRGEYLSKWELTVYYGIGEVNQVEVYEPKDFDVNRIYESCTINEGA